MTQTETDALHAEIKRQLAEESAALEMKQMGFVSLSAFPAYVRDEENPLVLFKGRWLERGGSAWIVSTSGTGKSIMAMQLMLSVTVGVPFAGLEPNGPLRCWYVQSEDSETRLGIDRDDVVAELTERHPDIPPERWKAAVEKIQIMPINGVGAEFLNDLTMKLQSAKRLGVLPDVLVINPFLAVVGGPITDGAFVTPFLRGGKINNEPTDGLQKTLERFGVGALIFHHTPKPPTDKEVQSWLKSTFPEYQGAGSSDITNWGRSFITMMRVPDRTGVVCLTAGKNGADLGWDNLDGGFRRYMAWSKSTGVTGRTRHAWRELDDEEMAEIVKDAGDCVNKDVDLIVEEVKKEPKTREQLLPIVRAKMSERRWRAAWATFKANCDAYGLEGWLVRYGKPVTDHIFFGVPERARIVAETSCSNWFEAHGVTGCHGVTALKCHPVASRGDGVTVPFRGTVCHPVSPQAETPISRHPVEQDVVLLTEQLEA